MKTIFTSLILLFNLNLIISQSCLPSGITFSSQADITNFPTDYPGCQSIIGDVTITGTDIMNLNGLSQLNNIDGFLHIQNNPILEDISGLDNLTNVGGFLRFAGQSNLGDVNGLNSILTIGLDLRFEADDITSISGFSNLSTITGNFRIQGSPDLITLSGLNSITSIGSYLLVNSAANLTTISGFSNLTSIGGDLSLIRNFNLTDISGLTMLGTINGALNLDENDALTDISPLENIDFNSISHLFLTGNVSLAVCNLPNICDYLLGGGSNDIASNSLGCQDENEVLFACEILPVSFIDFGVKHYPTYLKLQWSTVSEIHNSRFEIQKSKEGRDWEKLEFVEGQGTSNEINEYHYHDTNPFLGLNYYRLKQFDVDGEFEYSKVIVSDYKNSIRPVRLFPNPSNRLINIIVDNPSHKKIKVKISNKLGRAIWESGSIENKSNWKKEIDILENGVYLVTLQIGSEIHSERVIVVN